MHRGVSAPSVVNDALQINVFHEPEAVVAVGEVISDHGKPQSQGTGDVVCADTMKRAIERLKELGVETEQRE